MIKSDDDFKDIDRNIEKAGSGCLIMISAIIILIIYVIIYVIVF